MFGQEKIQLIIKEIFYVLTGTLVIFSVIEVAWPRIVLAYINTNWVLILWLISGILILLIKEDPS